MTRAIFPTAGWPRRPEELYAEGLEGVPQAELEAHARSYAEQDIGNLFPF